METQAEERARNLAVSLRVKRNNAIAALLVGLIFALLAVRMTGGVKVADIALGVLAGIVYANAFEYVLHRYFLHWGQGFLVQQHGLHHSVGPNEVKYILLSSSAGVVVLVFALNAIPVFAIAHWLDGGIAAGMFAAFTAYYIAYEEIHWRIHVGGLPKWMRFARRHHMLHHRGEEGRYNIFLPVCDWVFHKAHWKD